MRNKAIDFAKSAKGSALISALILISILIILGFSLVMTTHTDFRVAGAHRNMTEARYLAEAGLRQIPAMQNDGSQSPRYLYNTSNYSSTGVDPVFNDFTVVDPETSAVLGVATRRMVGGKDPMLDGPPYRIRSTAAIAGSVRTLEAEIAPRSLLEYVVWCEVDYGIEPLSTFFGKVYSAGTLTLNAAPITFKRRVEYVTALVNEEFGTYEDGKTHLGSPLDSLASVVDLAFYESASKSPGYCGVGVGLYIGQDAGEQHWSLFKRTDAVAPSKKTPGSPAAAHIDLTLFDFSGAFDDPPSAVTYNGVPLRHFGDASALTDFNGIIFCDEELYIWGINGGRSVEDFAVRDADSGNPSSTRYEGPNGTGENWYSNNRLDPGEDGTNGGASNGVLDPRGLGRSLTIVTASGKNIWIDHNIFMGTDADGRPVRTALISGKALHVSVNSPKTIYIHALLLSLGANNCPAWTGYYRSWWPCGNASSHLDNYWAVLPDSSYAFDLDDDGTLEANNGAPLIGDRNETSMLQAWAIIEKGNLVVADRPSSGVWAGDGHPRHYIYDESVIIYEPPCYPYLSGYDLVPGTFTEIR